MEDMKLLLSALENDDNENIFKLTSKEINDIKLNLLKELMIPNEVIIKILTELKEYIYVDELPDMKYGSFVKWISLTTPDKIKLTKGGIICDIIISESGSVLKCKNFKNRFMFVNVDKVLLFRKLSNQDKVLISVSNYLNK
jgi:hypothetical protein